jgi:hypothetical protein
MPVVSRCTRPGSPVPDRFVDRRAQSPRRARPVFSVDLSIQIEFGERTRDGLAQLIFSIV